MKLMQLQNESLKVWLSKIDMQRSTVDHSSTCIRNIVQVCSKLDFSNKWVMRVHAMQRVKGMVLDSDVPLLAENG